MTRSSAIEPNPGLPTVALFGGRWVPHRDLSIPIDDLGFRQAVTVVERLRTYGGRVFRLSSHLDRWQHSTAQLSIAGLPLRNAIEVLIGELIGRNQEFAARVGDFGITLLATPGPSLDGEPTFCMHLNAIDHALMRTRQERGQPLVVTDVSQPSSRAWPRSIKVRCRLHYFLADQTARQHHRDAVGLLVDDDGCVTETSVANLALVRDGQLLGPPRDRVLPGVTQSVVQEVGAERGLSWSECVLTRQDLLAADEVVLMGTDGGLWYARSVDGMPVASGRPGKVYSALRSAFDRRIGLC